jgi:hypothetical protein
LLRVYSFSTTIIKLNAMIYKFSETLSLNYKELEKYFDSKQELTKEEFLQECTGEIDYDLLQSLKELVFSKIGKTSKGELFIV